MLFTKHDNAQRVPLDWTAIRSDQSGASLLLQCSSVLLTGRCFVGAGFPESDVTGLNIVILEVKKYAGGAYSANTWRATQTQKFVPGCGRVTWAFYFLLERNGLVTGWFVFNWNLSLRTEGWRRQDWSSAQTWASIQGREHYLDIMLLKLVIAVLGYRCANYLLLLQRLGGGGE